MTELQKRSTAKGLTDVEVKSYMCFGACQEGPNIVLYPEKNWYAKVEGGGPRRDHRASGRRAACSAARHDRLVPERIDLSTSRHGGFLVHGRHPFPARCARGKRKLKRLSRSRWLRGARQSAPGISGRGHQNSFGRRSARPRRRGFSHRKKMAIHARSPRAAALPGSERRRRRTGQQKRPSTARELTPFGHRGRHSRGLCDRRNEDLSLHQRPIRRCDPEHQ